MSNIANAILILWLVFWVYWFSAAYGVKKNSTSIARPIGIRLGILIVLLILTILHVPIFDRNGLDTADKISQAVGFILFVLGLALAIWARLHLGKNWGMPMSQKNEPELVTTGPYKYIRHPIYSGIILASVGTAIAINLFWLDVSVIISVYFIYSATVEEKNMIKQFPAKYAAYKQKSKMLIPFIY